MRKNKLLIILISALIISILVFTTVIIIQSRKNSKTQNVIVDSLNKKESTGKLIPKTDTTGKQQYSLKDFFSESAELNKKVNEIYNKLNESERISQLIVPAAGVKGKPKDSIISLIKEKKIGGVLFLGGSAGEFKSLIKEFSETANKSGVLPLIYSCDAEPSLINSRIAGSPEMPKTSEIKDTGKSREIGNKITQFIKGLGFNQNFAPVCDFNINKEIIGDRSYGNTTDKVSSLAIEFIKATQELNVVATAKHFPGHGNVKGDSHKGIVTINGKPAELNVFKKIIESGVISVMVGHIVINDDSNLDTKKRPSSISRNIVTNLLKDSLGFKGIIVTDAMNMEGVSKFELPSLSALKAGCDMILMPSDEKKLLNSVLKEIRSDEKFKKQIENSVKKIIKLKICLNLI